MKKRLNSEDIVYLKFNPNSPEDMSENGLYDIKEEPVSIPSERVQVGSPEKPKAQRCPRLEHKRTHSDSDKALLPHTPPGSEA